MPNIWPVFEVKPDIVYNLYTNWTARTATALHSWLGECGPVYGISAKSEDVEVDDSQKMEDCYERCQKLISHHCGAGDDVIVNNTGGTKLMSGAAWKAAEETSRSLGCPVPVIYVEMRPASIIPVTFGEYYHELVGEPVEFHLKIRHIVQAHGLDVCNTPKDWHPYKKAAVAVWRARRRNPSDWEDHDEFIVADIKKPETAREALQKPLSELVSGSLAEVVMQGLQDAQSLEALTDPELKLFEIWHEDGKLHLPHNKVDRCLALLDEFDRSLTSARWSRKKWNKRWHPALNDVQASLNFLSGGWWEILTAWFMEQDDYDEIMWSVVTSYRTPPKDDKAEKNWESDIVACKDNQLTVVSCKRASKKINEMFAHSKRSKTLGGTNAVAKLSYYKPYHNEVADNLNIDIIDGNEVLAKLGLTL